MKFSATLILCAVAGYALCAAAEKQAYFGELHLHTSFSFDAFVNGTRATPDDAYRYAKGEPILHRNGETVQIDVPLDFAAVTDHAEYYGVFRKLDDPESPVSKHPAADRLTSDNRELAENALFQLVIKSTYAGRGQLQPDPLLFDEAIMGEAWQYSIETADKHYQPGEFSTFAAFEWTSTPTANESIHRNIIFADTNGLPDRPYSSIDSNRQEDLWAWIEQQRARGLRLMAIPHNSNMSGGKLFALETSDGNPIDTNWLKRRAAVEPLVEVVQNKGQSMQHPALAKGDPWAGFAVFDFFYGPWGVRETNPASYVHHVLGMGMQAREEHGINPYSYGFIGSTDCHWAFSPVREEHYSRGNYVGTREARNSNNAGVRKRIEASSGGLAGVWATENTREGIFAALESKETFATSGTRVQVRLFGGWDFPDGLAKDVASASHACKTGVPMGQTLPPPPEGAQAPTLLAWAKRDPNDGNLDRIQVIKSWLDTEGRPQSRIYDAAWAGDRKANPDTGFVTPVGNTVDVATATYENTIGAEELATVWHDPNFDPERPAVYYLRVLQIPTPRWTTYDAARLGVEPPPDVPTSIQERAWSSPIWYVPK